MKVGAQIVAPEGWASLPKDVVFHFLCSDARRGRVLLVHFASKEKGGTPQVSLVTLLRSRFEEGVLRGAIIPLETQGRFPPWLQELDGIDLSRMDHGRPSTAKILHRDRVERRYEHIAPAVREFGQILAAENPQAEINRRARLCIPSQNESRFRLWLLTYMCFGRDIWALLPPFHRGGHWDRFEFPERKFGAPSKAYGRGYGHGCSKKMAEDCVKSYNKHAKLGKHMTTIYEQAMVEDFHCRIVTHPGGMKVYASLDGSAFPTFSQFRYRVLKELGLEQVQKTLYGQVRHRTRIAASKGRFSEEVANLMERIEADGYYVNERPKGYVEGTILPPLCVVIGRDLLSGKKLGIGFSFGAERSTAYRMMLFSMAVPKDYFCRLFGVSLNPGEWVSEGLPSAFGIDRGPGARKDLIVGIEKRFPIRGMAPSWSGQSKATVESSHPKDVKIEGRPTYLQSNLTPVQLAIQEIMRLIEFNNTANMEDRLDPDSELVHVVPSPNGLWQHYNKLCRNDAQSMRIDEAVRTFLTPVEFEVKEDGVFLKGRRFYSEELRSSGLLDHAGGPRNVVTKINGYMLDMCVRYIWVEVEGRLIEVPAVLRIRGDDDSLFISIAELEQWSQARRKIGSAYRVHQRAVSSDIKFRFKQDTGVGFDSWKRRSGSPKRDPVSRQEASEVLHSKSPLKSS
jgi:hypothetical protein